MRVLLLLPLLLVPAFSYAQAPLRTITVYGEAQREVTPDQATVNVTVQAQDKNLQRAKQMHDEKMQELLKIAGSLQVERKDVKTLYASIQPQYDYVDNKQVFRSYMISTTLEVTLKRLSAVGELVQKLVDAKFDQVGNVQYSVDNDLAYRDEVLLEALDNAKDKAAKMAERMGAELGPVVQISQGYQAPQPIPMVRAMADAAPMMAEAKMAGGGVQPPEGMMNISGTVTVSYELK